MRESSFWCFVTLDSAIIELSLHFILDVFFFFLLRLKNSQIRLIV